MRSVEEDVLRDHCGIAGVFDPTGQIDIAQYLVIALNALQHRGQESAGIALLLPDGDIDAHTGMGRVRDVFPHGAHSSSQVHFGIGHVRYSTSGSSAVENAAPFVLRSHCRLLYDSLALAHNGNVMNVASLRHEVKQIPLRSETDSEVIAALLLEQVGLPMEQRIRHVAHRLRGAYSLVLLADGCLYGVRDPYGMRPLCLGRLGAGWMLASETCALDRVGATFEREINPGEVVRIDSSGRVSLSSIGNRSHSALCIFEYIYFSDATSQLRGQNVYSVREELGRQLAREYPADADLVVPIPQTAIPIALGYAEESGLPYAEPIIASRYADRSFIKPDQRLRQLEVDLKFNIVRSKVEGKRLVVVDDSIVRGNTPSILIRSLRRLGAKEVHVRIGSPPLKHPCYFGIDIPTETELIASNHSVDQIAEYINATSLGYLSLEGLARATGALTDLDHPEAALHRQFCYGCLARQGYPFPITDRHQSQAKLPATTL
ncbi:MAG: amidophosphoribosyltransferase [Chloroflexi bacterium]|nr:amidophosphoribosyltransferase [Chloroflexota bacterium]MCL5946797.1 amidophosphoribosyltransferase [Chloroflexota bacterium]